MAVGDVSLPKVIYPIFGVQIGVAQAGVRYAGRDDLTVFALAQGSRVALVTTTNQFCAAPVQLARTHHGQTASRYLLINTGNANAATGEIGLARANETCQALAEKVGVKKEQVLPFSTGVIGEHLPSERIIAGLDEALADLSADNWLKAAHAIGTTDTIPKLDSTQICIDDTVYQATGIAKGAGMIRPNMATMLAFVAVDANIEPSLLTTMLNDLTLATFNRITIDGDTSTNDCCVLVATGQDKPLIDCTTHPHYADIYKMLLGIFLRLATLIVRDGEGASKFITVKVTGGQSSDDCAKIAYAVAHSPLVKTAFFASDPNWGRILAAVGYAGVPLDQSQVNVSLDEVRICERGGLAQTYTEKDGKAVMSRPEITVHIELGQGQASDTVYTCDLSHDYVRINADYRS